MHDNLSFLHKNLMHSWQVLFFFQLKDDFQESVEMSTYLVAFVVCDYDHITERTKKNVSVSVYAPPDLIPQAKFALNIAKSMMDHYEEFFGFAYPLPKQGWWSINFF